MSQHHESGQEIRHQEICDVDPTVARALKAGKLAFTFHGARLKGSFALVRTQRGEGHPQWLLIKHKDEYATKGRDIVAEVMTSVESGRRMEEIAAGKKPRATKRANRARTG